MFSSKFSCGSSVTGDDEIVIQGDVSDDLFDFLPEKWPQVIKNSTKIDIIRIKNFLKISRYEVSESYNYSIFDLMGFKSISPKSRFSCVFFKM